MFISELILMLNMEGDFGHNFFLTTTQNITINGHQGQGRLRFFPDFVGEQISPNQICLGSCVYQCLNFSPEASDRNFHSNHQL